MPLSDILLQARREECARAGYEANRYYSAQLGDEDVLPWEIAYEWQKDRSRELVDFILTGDLDPEAYHEQWVTDMLADGWVYGPVRDEQAKTHPGLRPYDQLELEQRLRPIIFVTTVRSVANAFS